MWPSWVAKPEELVIVLSWFCATVPSRFQMRMSRFARRSISISVRGTTVRACSSSSFSSGSSSGFSLLSLTTAAVVTFLLAMCWSHDLCDKEAFFATGGATAFASSATFGTAWGEPVSTTSYKCRSRPSSSSKGMCGGTFRGRGRLLIGGCAVCADCPTGLAG